jgi:hypothetical protein
MFENKDNKLSKEKYKTGAKTANGAGPSGTEAGGGADNGKRANLTRQRRWRFWRTESEKMWDAVRKEIPQRYDLVFGPDNDPNEQHKIPLAIRATDVFVEKAIQRLTRRAKDYFHYGVGLSFVTFACIAGALGYLWINDITATLTTLMYQQDTAQFVTDNPSTVLTMWIIRTVAIGSLFGGAIYFTASLARACFHEATLLLHRRHAVRFGRLCVYLKEYGVRNQTKLTVDDMERAFGWNIESSTAFKDVDATKMLPGLTRMLEPIHKMALMIKEAKVGDEKKGKNNGQAQS